MIQMSVDLVFGKEAKSKVLNLFAMSHLNQKLNTRLFRSKSSTDDFFSSSCFRHMTNYYWINSKVLRKKVNIALWFNGWELNRMFYLDNIMSKRILNTKTWLKQRFRFVEILISAEKQKKVEPNQWPLIVWIHIENFDIMNRFLLSV